LFCDVPRADLSRYTSESQAFSLLSVLCDRLLPGYYSTTMYGTLLDQKVFESLVEKTMPIIWEHLSTSDVQLSIVSLPWFLSLYINSLPLVFAFRVLDVFFLEGPKVLFQVGLAILRINGEELLDVTDDGMFISVLKDYFLRLDESAHPNSENEKLRNVTKFQELMVIAFKEFSGITQGTIEELRVKHKGAVLDNIETFAKRTQIRNLGPDSKKLSSTDLGLVYDRFYGVLSEQERRLQAQRDEAAKRNVGRLGATSFFSSSSNKHSVDNGRIGIGTNPDLMNYDAFREMLAGMARWAVADSPRSSIGERAVDVRDRSPTRSPNRLEPADHDFMQRLFGKWNKDDNDGLSLGNVVSGLSGIKGQRDLMSTISYFFSLYDDDGDGRVSRDGILKISEALLFLTRRGLEGNFTLIESIGAGVDHALPDGSPSSQAIHGSALNEKFLSSVSAFIRRCFEYADPDHPQNEYTTIKEGRKEDQTNNITKDMDKFAIGDDEDEEDEDLLDFSDPKSSQVEKAVASTSPSEPIRSPSSEAESGAPSACPPPTRRLNSKASANLALDPANPLHITLPTFRMVILADELLQQFFEFSFAESFHIEPPTPGRQGSTLQAPSLTTFSNIGRSNMSMPGAGPSPAGAPSKGLRGLLDNVVTEANKMTSEMKKRYDEAQSELERNATSQGRDEEEEEDDEDLRAAMRTNTGDSEKGSVRSSDMDLLEGAEVGSIKDGDGIIAAAGGSKERSVEKVEFGA